MTAYYFLIFPAQPASNRWRSNDDLGSIYDSATPNPTGSLSGPWFDMPEEANGNNNVTAIQGKTAHLVCTVKNLGNKTVRNALT